jgi:murein L,D-transpeptidase YcbB/YkuD
MKVRRASACVVATFLLGSSGAFALNDGAAAPSPASTYPAAGTDASTQMFSPGTDQARPILSAADAAVAEKLRGMIENELQRHVQREQDRTDIQAFYRDRGFAPLWTSNGKPLPAATNAIEVLRGSAADGLDPADYPTPRFADSSPDRLAADELMLTDSVLSFARHASTGRVAFSRVSASVYYDLKFSAADLLRSLADSANARDTLQSLLPQHPKYKALKAALARARDSGDLKRADLIAANLERWRWLPHDLGTAYVVVNVPDYTLQVVNREETVWTTRIVAGKPGRLETPLLSQPMTFITVNPTWNVPPSIIRNEYLPALARDPGALARVGLKVGRNKDGSIRIYQPPGARNALGRIRFNFPNRFLVYQHDTPQKHLFEQHARAFSHGCMRVQNPEQYAQVLLSISQPEDGYTAARIRSMYGNGERTINFKHPIPVYVTYQTAFVDDAGRLQIRADVYGHDKAIAHLLKDERQVADIPVKRNYNSSSKPVMARLPSRDSGTRQASASYGRRAIGRDWFGRDAWGMETSQNWNQGWNTYQAGPRFMQSRRNNFFSMW